MESVPQFTPSLSNLLIHFPIKSFLPFFQKPFVSLNPLSLKNSFTFIPAVGSRVYSFSFFILSFFSCLCRTTRNTIFHVAAWPWETWRSPDSPLADSPTTHSTRTVAPATSSRALRLRSELNGEKLLVGANFASAGIGVLDDTGIQFLNIIRIRRQFEMFEEYQKRLAALIGADQAKQRVNQGLYLIVLGGNDFVNNYFLPFSVRPAQYSLPDYAQYVVSEYEKVLTRLYELGARRVMVPGSGPLGCVPFELASNGRNGECAEEPQKAAAIYNPLLVQMVQRLNTKLGSDVFIAANTGKMQKDFITDPQAFGFETSKEACCGQGPNNGIGLCNPTSNLCPNRNTHAFWDPFHPTEKANRIIVQQMLTASNEYMSPMNLSTIMALDSRV